MVLTLLFNCNEKCSNFQNCNCTILLLSVNFGLFTVLDAFNYGSLNLIPVCMLDPNVWKSALPVIPVPIVTHSIDSIIVFINCFIQH